MCCTDHATAAALAYVMRPGSEIYFLASFRPTRKAPAATAAIRMIPPMISGDLNGEEFAAFLQAMGEKVIWPEH